MLDCISENLREAIEKLAPEKTVRPKKKSPPSIDTELQLMIDKRNNLHRRSRRNRGSYLFLSEIIKVCDGTEIKSEVARNAYLQARIGDAFDNKKNMWKKLRHLGLLPEMEDALHGFSPDELNIYFAGVSVRPSVRLASGGHRRCGEHLRRRLALVTLPSGQFMAG